MVVHKPAGTLYNGYGRPSRVLATAFVCPAQAGWLERPLAAKAPWDAVRGHGLLVHAVCIDIGNDGHPTGRMRYIMIIKANAKLNWTLNLLGERADGYHELDMLMQSVDLCDELELEDADEFSLTIVGGAEVSAGEDNLVLRAARLLAHECGVRTCANIRLVKRIPARAGLGGGSSDAAAVLHALNAHWRAGVGLDELCALGMRLGADIPYCLTGGLCRVQGLGEQVSRMDGAPEVNVVIAMPDAGLSTAAVFAQSTPCPAQDTRAAAEALCERDWNWLRHYTANDLQPPAERLRPGIAKCQARMYELGAEFARMSGSGSAVFGVFPAECVAEAAARLGAEYPECFAARTLA